MAATSALGSHLASSCRAVLLRHVLDSSLGFSLNPNDTARHLMLNTEFTASTLGQMYIVAGILDKRTLFIHMQATIVAWARMHENTTELEVTKHENQGNGLIQTSLP